MSLDGYYVHLSLSQLCVRNLITFCVEKLIHFALQYKIFILTQDISLLQAKARYKNVRVSIILINNTKNTENITFINDIRS